MLLCVRCQNLVPSKVCADAVSTIAIDIWYHKYFLCKQGDSR